MKKTGKKTVWTKKLLILTVIPLILCGITVVHYWTTSLNADATEANPEPVVKVVLDVHNADDDRTTREYQAVYSASGRLLTAGGTDEFEPDDAEVYFVSEEGFQTGQYKAGGEIGFYRSDDPYGWSFATDDDPHVLAIRKAIKEQEHDILEMSLWELPDSDLYFIFCKLNVNLWTPCELMSYDPETGKLTNLYEWDNVDLIGLSVAR